MKAYFKYSTNDWALLPMATGKNDSFNTAIDKPVLTTITVNRPGFMLLHDGLAGEGGWTKASTTWHFTKIVLVDDSVASTDLDSDVDAVKKYWCGKVVQIIPQELTSQLICEQYHGQLWREQFDEDDNVVTIDGDDEFKIKSFTSLTDDIEVEDASGNAVTFDDDENNGRGCRITARAQEVVECIVESNDDISQDGAYTTYTENYGNLDNRVLIGETGVLRTKGASDTTDDADAFITMLVTVPRQPCKANTIHVTVTVHSPYHTDPTFTAGPLPYLDIYDRDASAWVRLKTWAIGECSDWGDPYQVDLKLDTDDFDKFWDSSTSKVTFRFYSGYCQLTATGKYWSYLNVTEFYIRVKCYGETSPREYVIQDTLNSDELDLVTDTGVYDTFVNRHSIGDKVEILAHNEEWLENNVLAYAVDINAINAPTSAAPTYSKKRFKTIGQDIKDINELEEWYCYLTQSTTSGKPDLTFVDRSAPTSSGYVITPECIVTNKGNILPKFNCLDKAREVVITNGTDTGTSGAVAVSNYPRLTATHKDTPQPYLATLATAILNQRGAVSDDYELTIDKVWDPVGSAFVTLLDLDEDEFMAGLTVDLEAGNARGSGTTPIDVDDVIIRELKWLPSMDAALLKLGFADNSHKSKTEKMFELIARERYEAGQ